MPNVSHVSRLTQAGVDRMKSPKKGRIQKRDSIVPGLCVRVSETGLKSYSLITRLRGKQVRLPIGRHGVIKLTEARDKAREAMALIDKGIDPRVEWGRVKEASTDAIEEVVEDYIERYVEVHNRPRSAVETNRALRKRIKPAWKGRSIRDITRRDIIDLLEDIAVESPATANRTKATISGLFNWCLDRGILDSSPAVRLKAPAPIVERERVLTDNEIKRLWPAFDKRGEPFGAYFKFLLLTGQRRMEVATMQWDHVDLDNALWTIPA
ncbi:MAG: integrase arm-type DNA-binding domain-containing protein [Alphaproteobacteria bacterium]|nr:integrase arm-type DNA-binding domain-containing protein [Alphaproteobacteria bacterium]